MPSPERPNRSSPEREPVPYCRAARFAGEQPAGRAYIQAQEAIREPECDLSAYRLRINDAWHVAVLGQTPPDELITKVEEILSSGEPVTLPPDVFRVLSNRRLEQMKHGSWVERHHRPGKRL